MMEIKGFTLVRQYDFKALTLPWWRNSTSQPVIGYRLYTVARIIGRSNDDHPVS